MNNWKSIYFFELSQLIFNSLKMKTNKSTDIKFNNAQLCYVILF